MWISLYSTIDFPLWCSCVCVCGCVSVLCAWLEIHFCIFYNNQHIASPAHSPCGKVWRGIENKSLAFHTSLAFSGPRCQLFAQIIKIFSHECQHSPHLDWSPVAGRRSPAANRHERVSTGAEPTANQPPGSSLAMPLWALTAMSTLIFKRALKMQSRKNKSEMRTTKGPQNGSAHRRQRTKVMPTPTPKRGPVKYAM